MEPNKRLKMMNEESLPSSSNISSDNLNDDESKSVKLHTNAVEAMKLWKEEIVSSEKYDVMVPDLLDKSNVQTVQDIVEKWKDDEWISELARCGVNTFALRKKLDVVLSNTKNSAVQTRMVPVDYRITDSKLSHKADLVALFDRVKETFGWYDASEKLANDASEKLTNDASEKENVFVAPYFPMIQSSGMGKTKLLHELRGKLNDLPDTSCQLCLSGKIETTHDGSKPKENNNGVYSVKLNLNDVVTKYTDNKEKASDAAEAVMKNLDGYFRCSPKPKHRLVLLFDEAQVLLEKYFDVDAFLFQCVRLWLREKKTECKRVAIFAGTTSSLSNFYPDERIVRLLATRDLRARTYHPRGNRLPLPFYQTTTIGCCLTMKSSEPAKTNEYNQAVPYGRPLFAVMAMGKNELENRLGIILGRMLLSDVATWDKEQDSCLSILATRVQMGQTSTKTASRLVSMGYANLVGFSDSKVAQICYFPDPVCARLAMAMMDKDWSMEVEGSKVCGKEKSWWVEMARDSFSGGLCRPDKGDVGEIFAALYLLFCGDLLRKDLDDEYKTFSVPLDCWVSKLIKPPEKPMKQSTELDILPSTTKLTRENAQTDSVPSISFIQVCRNYLRPYKEYRFLTCQFMLKYLYESGTAFFTFPFCPDFDIVASIRYKRENGFHFAPLLISVKARLDFNTKEADDNCKTMERKLNDVLEAATSWHRALCIVMVIGAAPVTDDADRTLNKEDINNFFATSSDKKVMAKVLRIKDDDGFGITKALLDATSDGQEMSEIFASHSFVRAHAKHSPDLKAENSMRQQGSKKREGAFFLENLVEQLKSEPTA